MRRAILSVSDKTGLTNFAKKLSTLGVELVSTGGTAKALSKERIPVTEVSDVTGYPEMLDGRVKTMHPAVHGAVLALRDNKEHMRKLGELGIAPIDMVVVNLYPFEQTVSKENVALEDAIENIDIGGPALVRAAAKNYRHVAVVVSPSQYADVIRELEENSCRLSEKTLSSLAVEAFKHTSWYDSVICGFLEARFGLIQEFPSVLNLTYKKVMDLRYGENPHQRAAFYSELKINEACVTNAKQLHGKQLSYNNIIDLNDAFELVKDFEKPTAAVIKHTNPCGVASADNIFSAYQKAHESDPLSAFGSVVALNRELDLKTAELMKPFFIEAVIAPSFSDSALKLLKEKPNIRLLASGGVTTSSEGVDLRKVVGGMLAQSRNFPVVGAGDIKVVSKRKPSKDEVSSMLFGWKINRHVKSNSIVLCKDEQTVGIGAGQMSRVDAVKIAVEKSGGKSRGSVMVSDAFFPFRDGIDAAQAGGVTAVIQPGGSIRDKEVIDAVDEYGMAMVFTGVRCFKH